MKSKRIFIYSLFILIIILSLFSILFLPSKITGNFVIITTSSARIDPGIRVIYDTFDGSTTDFLYLNDTQLSSIENMVVENSSNGKIIFNGSINLASDAILNIVDLDNGITISSDSIYINTTYLSSLTGYTTITFYNESFTKPVAYKNGQLCPNSECYFVSYDGENATFNLSFDSTPYTNITLGEAYPKSWDSIEYPEGVYEPYNIGLVGTHLHRFGIKFVNMNASSGDVLGCYIKQSNGSVFFLNETLLTSYNSQNYSLNYTVANSDNISKFTRWEGINCTLTNSTSLKSLDNDYYFSRLKRSIFVHGNNWTKFNTVDDDAYLASRCFLGIPKRYFNNSHYCDYVGDVAFAVSMATGFAIEGYCDDGIDNDNNGNTDCDDRYCRGIPYTCIDHRYAGDPFYGECQNGVCWETKNFGGRDITYYYNRYVQPGGTLKIRFEGGDYNTTKPISYAITDLLSYDSYGYYSEGNGLGTISTTDSSVVAEDGNGRVGDADMVLWVNLSSAYTDGNEYNVSIYLVHEGYDLLVAGIPIVIDSTAPSVWDESVTGKNRTSPCSNSIDEDIDYNTSCQDLDCNGSIGGSDCARGNAYCEFGSETTCNDCFDNEGDGNYDCADLDCDLKSGSSTNSSIKCHYYGEGNQTQYNSSLYSWVFACVDLFDNDQDDAVDCEDRTFCWQRGGTSLTLPCPAYENNTALWCHDGINNDYDNRTDCADYDCWNVSYANATYSARCPDNESQDKFGNFKPLQCFDSLDNDLDSPIQKYSGLGTNIDCADIDCNGVTHPTLNVTCMPFEYNLSLNITPEYCMDNLDLDGDKSLGWPNGGLDCNDPDCNKQFGSCGPCPSFEYMSYGSCADNIDQDTDRPTSYIDCEDTDCLGKMGSKDSSQVCAASENTITLCSDEFDNDANGNTDCADSNCNGIGICEYSTETTCNDQLDNDGDGDTDCLDSDCYGIGSCASMSWTAGSCLVVPYNTSSLSIGSTSVTFYHTSRHHINNKYYMNFASTESYSSVTITVGDATDSNDYFPYNASTCTLSGDTNKINLVTSQDEVFQLQDRGSFTGGFNVTIECDGLSSAQTNTYPIIISNSLQSSATESADESYTAVVYENTAPSVSSVEVDLWDGSVAEVNYGDPISLRAIPLNDPSNICKCSFNIGGNVYNSSDGNCIYEHDVYDDTSYTLSAAARDGAYNLGTYGGTRIVPVNVLPVQDFFAISRNYPFFNSTAGESIVFTSLFKSATSGSISSCNAWIEDESGSIVLSKSVTPVGSNSAACNNNFNTSSLADGIYYVRMNATDEDGDTVTSDKKLFYVCSNYTSSGSNWNCSIADFDQDGQPDQCDYALQYDVGVDLAFNFEFISNYSIKITSIYEAVTDFLLLEKTTNASFLDFKLPTGEYDVNIDVFDGNLIVHLNDLNLTIESNYTFAFDMYDGVNGIRAYAFSPGVNFSSAYVKFDYSELDYVREANLVLYKCDGHNYNFTTRRCMNDSWYLLNSTINSSTQHILADVDNFSGFYIYENPPTPKWTRLLHPEGVYEPYNAGLPGKHLHTFALKFENLNTSLGTELECLIEQSDGTLFNVTEPVTQNTLYSNFSLNYTIKNTDNVSKLTPWEIVNCTLYRSDGVIEFSDDTEFSNATYNLTHLNRSIFVHGNEWTRFDTSNDDAYRAARCFLGFPKRYFNNSYYCDYVGDVAFAVSMSLGMNLEGNCQDGIDNDGNGDVDCDDRYCQGLPYSCKNHVYAGDPFEGTCSNGICTESRTFGVPAKTLTYSFTKYVKPNGTFKVRFNGGSYSTSSPVLYSVTDLNGVDSYGHYNRTGYDSLESFSSTATSVATESSSGHSGNVDFVMWINLSDYSEGNYNISYYFVHNGQDLYVQGIPIVVTDNAVSNWDESETGTYTTLPCANSADEDLDYIEGCLDLDCDGEIGGTNCVGGNAYCEYGTELTCYDCFDNDDNGAYDCGESVCDLKRGSYNDASILCHYNGEGHSSYDSSIYSWANACNDGFNNDQEDGTDCYDTTFCRGRGGSSTTLPCPANESNDPSWCFDSIDNDFDGMMDCNDLDCSGVIYGDNKCPTKEMETTSNENSSLQCFDSIDNDYDGSSDCSDTADCRGVVNLLNWQVCHSSEFNSSYSFSSMFGGYNTIEYTAPTNIVACLNNINDDGDGDVNCYDDDCNGKSGECGPCPDREDVSFTSCSNNLNDDYSGGSDCVDSDCYGLFGEFTSSSGSVKCQASENNNTLCSDEYDNDADGNVDCEDNECDGYSYCEHSTETTCNDEYDNDADGKTDCADSDCFGVSGCSAMSWTATSCTAIPASGSLSLGSVSASYLTKHHINSNYTISFTGSGDYDSVTVTLGDATNSSLYFPYNATQCVLSGDTDKVKWVSSQNVVGQLQDNSSFTGGFTATLTCPGLSTVQTNSYSITTSNQVDGSTESYSDTLSTTTYENTLPSVNALEQSHINLEYNEGFYFRGIPSNDPSGICTCLYNISGTQSLVDGNCIKAMNLQTIDTSYNLGVAAKDGASNIGSYTSFGSYNVNVMIIAKSVSIGDYFYNSSSLNSISVSADFQTADNGQVVGCNASIINSTGQQQSIIVMNISGTNDVTCSGNIDISSLSDGDYIVEFFAVDEDGDNASIETVFSICSDNTSSPMCAYMDLDKDGIPDNKDCKYLLPFMDYPYQLKFNYVYSSSENPSPKYYIYKTGYNYSLFNKNLAGASSTEFDIVEDIYDFVVLNYDDKFSVRFNSVNITQNETYTIKLDNLDNTNTYGYKTYAIDIDPEKNSDAIVTVSYDGLNYTNETNIDLYVCSDWNMGTRSCKTNWVVSNSTQYFAENLFRTTYGGSFQAGFSIADSQPIKTTPPPVEEEEEIPRRSGSGPLPFQLQDLIYQISTSEIKLSDDFGKKETKQELVSFSINKKQFDYKEVIKESTKFYFSKLIIASFNWILSLFLFLF